MKTRILSAVIFVPLLLVSVLFLPKIVTAVLVSILSSLAAYELLYGTGLVKHPRLLIYTMAAAFAVPLQSFFHAAYAWVLLGILLYCGLLFGEMLLSGAKLSFEKLGVCLAAGMLFPFLLSSLVRIHGADDGRYLIMIPLVLASLTDTGAYCTGITFGKHKLAPVISPHKTVEGVIGGFVGAVMGMVIYCLVLQLGFRLQVDYLNGLIYGLLGSTGAVFGDLCFSAIKRQVGIKDYGSLIPGHGGVLDRFDSMMIVAPLAEALIILLPVVV